MHRFDRLVPPDYEEQRGDSHLMVWRDIPYWTVVDSELRELLAVLDGTVSLGQAAEHKGATGRTSRDAKRAVRTLASRGVLTRVGLTRRAPRETQPRIENVAVNVTLRCNLRCAFCYNADRLGPCAQTEVSSKEIAAVLESARPLMSSRPSLSLLGGEPLLEPEKVIHVAEHAGRTGMSTIVATNGTLVTPEFAREAARTNLQVQVSLDGASAATNDTVRSQGVYDKAIEGARRLVDAGVYTLLSMVCHEGNSHELGAFYTLGQRLGVDEVRFIPLKRIGGADRSGLEPLPLGTLVSRAAELFAARPELKPLTGRDAFSILASTCKHATRRHSCGTGLETFLLDANGDIYPCLNTNTERLRVANVREPAFDFAAVWAGSPVLQAVRSATDVRDPGCACCNCVVKFWCLGGCRGETLRTKGDLSRNAWNCAEQRATILDMLWTVSESPDLVKTAEPLDF